ncbi:hypothetical protein PPL_11400 [Heterostelium album PN500]|uniref:Cathepsin propeptide inhibitor domain-containing protein n=1 Tax=Heterostelium pallidum (strain ATCC 26659 / Pp 5 / PN500) TaxID=670386 RepID=D3BTA7_HETP5|nr:hypothetical protein PPL_11400 [Heterostelium album PN500]EFA75324.1 hypothetical protein PPL_11400 [Heterostelium album PN500]|eukprot:XP_020427458.1 hypothetical protein PPL_11400 [Heterostelium album PN500]
MRYLLLFISCIIFTSCVLAEYKSTEADIQAVFKSWSAAYQKTYTNDEFQSAYLKWKDNFQAVNQHNSQFANLPDAVVSNPSSNINSLLNDAAGPTITYPKADAQLQTMNYYGDMSYSEFASTFTGATPPAVAAAGLAASTIAAIAAGGAVFVAGAATTTVVIIKKRRANQNKEVELQGKEISSPTPIPEGATNVFNLEPPHHSITARLFGVKK